ncbi:hypothetical protein NT05LI_3802, partial [Listeria ivanovii FSL F6-596]
KVNIFINTYVDDAKVTCILIHPKKTDLLKTDFWSSF